MAKLGFEPELSVFGVLVLNALWEHIRHLDMTDTAHRLIQTRGRPCWGRKAKSCSGRPSGKIPILTPPEPRPEKNLTARLGREQWLQVVTVSLEETGLAPGAPFPT